ncbi:fasciclin domain-containing protein [Nostocaceae cyanobacterium CENA357]|uniref:Fasciclin domain-containing protein n=1 Tax=Atlanticothrix silvestris CENA357 TaxID=1725252 RepID=A0A8J7HAK9_9CYAN|nr:fasciclin domain-containing protein [Atlanticothrix silvestris]MBH8552269.1 fasciclin domain-containing protein [Atlanticothrix silvestris CENA357]
MKTKNFVVSIRKFASFAIGMLLLPVFAACLPNNTAQVTPTTTAPPESVPTTPPITPGATVNEDITDIVQANPSLKTLANLIDEADLEQKLDDTGSCTLFAPSDQAFAALPEVTRQRLLKTENRELLRQVLTYHVVPGNLTTNQLRSQEIKTLGNNPVNIQVDQANNQVRINDALVVQPDIRASNGVIHIVDRVILPPMIQ